MSKAEETRNYIIERTAPVFHQKGFSGTSLSDITTVTGLTKGSIYGNFENKDEVALAAFDYNVQRMRASLRSAMLPYDKALDKLKAQITTFQELMKASFLRHGCPLMNTITEADDTHVQLGQKVKQAVHIWKKHIEKVLQAGIEQGELTDSINAEQEAVYFIAVLEGAVFFHRATRNWEDTQVILKQLERHLDTLARKRR